ncbi:MAG: hypothetical protein R3B93_15805 [Bacteroidia bacterium]
MILANPIYDVVFKYLMEDTEIARRLLSKITGEEIIDISVQPQEYAGRSDKFEIIILRLDFKATIKTKEGKRKKVLIELQKGKNSTDIMRFRKYLGDNYRKEDISAGKKKKKEALPIITIYFLGFRLANVITSIMKVNREYIDLITNERIEANEEFVEKLTHDSYIIQIPRLKKRVRNEIERVLKVFNQSYNTNDDRKTLEFQDEDFEDDELLKMIAERLRKGATEEELLRKIEIEEEVENTIEQHIREKQELTDRNNKLRNTISEKDQTISEKDQTISEKDKLIEELKRQLDEKKKRK